jgi:hypothetical protein
LLNPGVRGELVGDGPGVAGHAGGVALISSMSRPRASYQAANWIWIGYTKGRGKLDRSHQHAQPVKDVYLYSLRHDYRDILTSQ